MSSVLTESQPSIFNFSEYNSVFYPVKSYEKDQVEIEDAEAETTGSENGS